MKLLQRSLTVTFIAILAFQVGNGPPCEAQENKLRKYNQTNLLAIHQNTPDTGFSHLEMRIENIGVTGEDHRDDAVENCSDEFGTRTVRVGIYQNPPKIFIDEKGLPSGIFIDLLDDIAKKEKWNLVYIPCEWSECLDALEKHRIDLMPDVAYSRGRDTKYDFHETPVLYSWSQVYRNSSTSLSTLSDLNGRRIAVLKGGIQEEIFKQIINGFGFEVTIVQVKTYEEGFRLAENGSVDAVISNHFIGDYSFQKYGLIKTPIIFNPVSLYIVTAQGRNPELLDTIERHLNAWRKQPNSHYYKTLARWMEKAPEQVVPRYLLWIIVVIGGLLVLLFGIIQLLNVQIKAKTRHLIEANELLRKNEEKYRSLIENLNDVIFTLDMEGNITYISPVIEKLFGYKPEEVVNRPAIKYVHPDDLNGLLKSMGQTVSGKMKPYEFRGFKKDGEVRHVRTSSRIQFEEGVPVGITGVMTDITERKRAEEALRESEKKYRMIADNVPVGIFIQVGGKIKYCGKETARLLGYGGPEDIIGKDLIEFVYEDDREYVLDRAKKIAAGEDLPTGYEIKIIKKGGETLFVLVYGSNLNYMGETARQGVFIDITERKRAEELLRESEKKWRGLFENSIQAVFTVDIKGNFTSINDALASIMGYEKEEIIGSSFAKYGTPEVAEDVFKAYNHLYRTGEPIRDFTYETIRKDGEVRTVEAYVNTIRKGDETIGFQGTLRDITERKRSEERIFHLNRVLKSIRNINQLIVIEKDKKTLLGQACEILVEVSGYLFVWIGMIEEGHKKVIPVAQWGFEDGYLEKTTITWDDEKTGRGPTGTAIKTKKTCVLRDVLNSSKYASWQKEAEKRGYKSSIAVPLVYEETIHGALNVYSYNIDYFDKEEVMLLEEVAQDIAFALSAIETEEERKRAEKNISEINKLLFERTVELKQSEEKWRNIFETSRDVIYIAALDGKFIDINPAGEELFGYARDELLSMDIKNLFLNPEYKKIFLQIIEKEEFVKDQEIIFKKKDGTLIDVLVTATVRRDGRGYNIGYNGIIRDITERKKIAAQLIQTEKLSSLGGILSGVAHELNNPLTAIIGNAQLLAKRYMSGEIRDKLEVIQKESMRCTKIVGGLLAFAREHKPERRMINVNDVIVESCKLREYELSVDDIDVELELSENIPATSADPYQLQQVFINLINNAHDALKEKSGGTLNIRSFRRDETILIEFDDNGLGIPKENINKIFDPFFTTKEVGKGTGLGLSIIYGIINEHGGKMNVESEIGKGAKFTIELPIVKDIAEIDEVKIERPKKPEGTISVLVVEDEESLREVISEALSNEGYVVQTANSGDRAIELLKKGGYDVIISDMKMPGMSGQNLYTFVQKEYPELTDRMLFITGDVLGKETQNFFKITGVKYVEKPFEINALLNKLNEMFDE